MRGFRHYELGSLRGDFTVVSRELIEIVDIMNDKNVWDIMLLAVKDMIWHSLGIESKELMMHLVKSMLLVPSVSELTEHGFPHCFLPLSFNCRLLLASDQSCCPRLLVASDHSYLYLCE